MPVAGVGKRGPFSVRWKNNYLRHSGRRMGLDVYRNGAYIVTTPNDGAHTDKPPKTLTSATYKVCNVGTSTCSNEVTVTW